jgi:hypothetical protein
VRSGTRACIGNPFHTVNWKLAGPIKDPLRDKSMNTCVQAVTNGFQRRKLTWITWFLQVVSVVQQTSQDLWSACSVRKNIYRCFVLTAMTLKAKKTG